MIEKYTCTILAAIISIQTLTSADFCLNNVSHTSSVFTSDVVHKAIYATATLPTKWRIFKTILGVVLMLIFDFYRATLC